MRVFFLLFSQMLQQSKSQSLRRTDLYHRRYKDSPYQWKWTRRSPLRRRRRSFEDDSFVVFCRSPVAGVVSGKSTLRSKLPLPEGHPSVSFRRPSLLVNRHSTRRTFLTTTVGPLFFNFRISTCPPSLITIYYGSLFTRVIRFVKKLYTRSMSRHYYSKILS